MSRPTVSDQEFMETWNRVQSATEVSKIIGVAATNVHARRRRLEKKHDWRAPVYDARRPSYNTAPIHSANKAIVNWHIQDGVILVGSDAHIWPGELTTAQRAFQYFVKNFDPAPIGIIANGDIFDGARISRWPAAGFLETGKPNVKQELEAVQNFLAPIEQHRRNARLIWCLGNHCLRFESRLAAVAPEYEGIGGFHLKDHFPAWTPCWRTDINDNLIIKHRWHNGIHAVYNNALKGGRSIVTGHLHSLKVTPWTDYNGTRYGVDTGCLADTDGDQTVHYLEGNATNWRSGFAVLTIKQGRLMLPELVQKFDEDHVEFRGQLIRV